MLKQIIVSVFLLPSVFFAQHTIKGTFTNAEDYKHALLYKILPVSTEYVTSSEVKKDGSFELQLDATVAPGMYKIVYAIPKDEYSFDVIYNGKEDIELTFDSEKGISYQQSTENKLMSNYSSSMTKISQSIGNFYRQVSSDTLALMTIFKTQRETQKNFEDAAKGTIALEFIKANRPYIPNQFEDIKTYIGNLETHFFDNVDFNNKTLQSSSFLLDRMYNYVLGMTTSGDDKLDSYKKNIDAFYLAMKDAPIIIKSSLLLQLWEKMLDLEEESVANYISDAYLLDIAKSLNDQVLVNGLLQFKKTSLQSKAPDFSLDGTDNGKKLSSLNGSDYYVVVFWSSECSHCLHEIPILESYIETLPKGDVQVVAVGLEDDDKNWSKKIKDFPDFIHVLGLGKWDNKIGDDYNVTATPTYFVLDKDKLIIAKPDTVEDLKSFFDKKHF
ncbi:TlpA disulfide reductase family protein [Yeosuana marina]|uniref:TlpA family protein disulfide reductase n=1 Tax=Yeosuana marina TaxID=1565536 RepID=UPI0030C8B474